MVLKKWDDLPEFMRTEAVKPYYEYLKKKKAQLVLKRIFDIICSLLLIILFSPILLIISIWIKIDSKGPVFYRQERVTQYGRIFKIFKFRTMVNNADKKGTLVTVKNDSRITKVGDKIRKYRIDEIPQLFNILSGDMTFVGTRPEVKKYVDAYTDEMYATLLLRAGVTSMTSIRFRDEDEVINQLRNERKSIDQIYIYEVLPLKMELNLKEMNSFSFVSELKVLKNTLMKV